MIEQSVVEWYHFPENIPTHAKRYVVFCPFDEEDPFYAYWNGNDFIDIRDRKFVEWLDLKVITNIVFMFADIKRP